MGEVNRSLAAPWTILTDQSDSMAQRDTGWMQFYCGSNQEVFDSAILAYKIAEETLLPVMVVLDAFVLSHCVEAVELPSQEQIDTYLPPRGDGIYLDPQNPHAFGGMMFPDSFMEQRVKIQQAMEYADGLIERETESWHKATGRQIEPLQTYMLEDAEVVTVCLGTAYGAFCKAVDDLRAEGVKAGAVRMWQYRPFPVRQLEEQIPASAAVGVVDRACSFGMSGPVGSEVKAVLGGRNPVYGFIAGLGGREITPTSAHSVYRAMREKTADAQGINWVEVRS